MSMRVKNSWPVIEQPAAISRPDGLDPSLVSSGRPVRQGPSASLASGQPSGVVPYWVVVSTPVAVTVAVDIYGRLPADRQA